MLKDGSSEFRCFRFVRKSQAKTKTKKKCSFLFYGKDLKQVCIPENVTCHYDAPPLRARSFLILPLWEPADGSWDKQPHCERVPILPPVFLSRDLKAHWNHSQRGNSGSDSWIPSNDYPAGQSNRDSNDEEPKATTITLMRFRDKADKLTGRKLSTEKNANHPFGLLTRNMF